MPGPGRPGKLGNSMTIRLRTPNNSGASATNYDTAGGANDTVGSSDLTFWTYPYETNPNGGSAFSNTALDAMESGALFTISSSNTGRAFQTGVMVLRDNSSPPTTVQGISTIQGISTLQF